MATFFGSTDPLMKISLKNFWNFYTIGETQVKFFSGNENSKNIEKIEKFFSNIFNKNMRGIRIWHFRSEKRFPDSGKAYCVLKRKVAKYDFEWDFRLFASIHRPSLNQESVFSLCKCQIRIPRMFLPPTEIISRKFSRGWPPFTVSVSSYCVSSYHLLNSSVQFRSDPCHPFFTRL